MSYGRNWRHIFIIKSPSFCLKPWAIGLIPKGRVNPIVDFVVLGSLVEGAKMNILGCNLEEVWTNIRCLCGKNLKVKFKSEKFLCHIFLFQSQKRQDGLVALPMSKVRVRRGSSLGIVRFFKEGSGFRMGSLKPSFGVECLVS